MGKFRLLNDRDIIKATDEWYDSDNNYWVPSDCAYNKLGFIERLSNEANDVTGTKWIEDYPPFRRVDV